MTIQFDPKFVKMDTNMDSIMKIGDPRLAEWFLMQSPTVTIIISVIYATLVTTIGPMWMQSRKPCELRKYMIFYNLLVVLLSLWIFLRFALHAWFKDYSWYCEPIDFSNNDSAVAVLTTFYMFYLSKFIELLDTTFFVLRKKQSQITFLHVFHHAILPISSWYGTKYGGGGYAVLFPMINSFVHIWMYLYYALAAIGPSVQKYLWWKKHLTKLQLMQFVIMTLYMTRILITDPKDCNTTTFIIWLHLGQALAFFGLFMHFYIKSYKKRPSTKCS